MVNYIYKLKIYIIFALPKLKIMKNYDLSLTKKSCIAILLFLNLTLFCHASKPAKLINYSGPIIVIDAGHGGHDPGTVGKFSQEKDITLSISQKLGWMLMSAIPDATILYTRNSDEFLPLYRRAAVANQNKADLFISIHCNAMSTDKHKHRGTETFVLGIEKANENLEIVKLENNVLNLEHNSEAKYRFLNLSNEEAHIIMSQYQDLHLDNSIKIAKSIENNFHQYHPGGSRGVKQAGFVVLAQTSMPSILIEAGFLSNEDEEIFLNSEDGQLQIARYISDGVTDFFQSNSNYVHENHLVMESTDITYKSPIIETPIVEALEEKIEQIEYRIQIAASKGEMIKMDHPAWQKVPSFQIVHELDLYKYQVGNYNNFKDALAEKENLQKIGFSDAFIVNYKNGTRINKS